MYDYDPVFRLLVSGGTAGAIVNAALAAINVAGQRRIVRQQRLIVDRQQQMDAQRLDLEERAQTWSEMRDLIGAQARQLQAGRFELTQLTGKYEELLRRYQILENEWRERHNESVARIEALEQERNRWMAESANLRARLESKSALSSVPS